MTDHQTPEDERDGRCLRQGHDYVEIDRKDGWITFQCAFCGAEAQEQVL